MGFGRDGGSGVKTPSQIWGEKTKKEKKGTEQRHTLWRSKWDLVGTVGAELKHQAKSKEKKKKEKKRRNWTKAHTQKE